MEIQCFLMLTTGWSGERSGIRLIPLGDIRPHLLEQCFYIAAANNKIQMKKTEDNLLPLFVLK